MTTMPKTESDPKPQKIIAREIPPHILAKRAGRLGTTPSPYRGMFERSWLKKCPPSMAIKCFCLECIGFEKKAITECTAWACPLWAYRPYQKNPAK